jgi:hypothetical protein
MRPALAREKDLRERLGKIRTTDHSVDEYIEVAEEMKRRMEVSFVLFPLAWIHDSFFGIHSVMLKKPSAHQLKNSSRLIPRPA